MAGQLETERMMERERVDRERERERKRDGERERVESGVRFEAEARINHRYPRYRELARCLKERGPCQESGEAEGAACRGLEG